MPFKSLQFILSPNQNNNFSLSNTTIQMQFYPNMRYPSPNISYSIDNSLCNLQRQQDMQTALNTIQNITILKFNQVDSNPEISISCDNKVVINENYFVAGEGGPVNITQTDDYNVITHGEVLLLKDSNCPVPNVAIHELLHSLGFNHSQNPNNIMYPVTNCYQTIGQDIPDLINSLYSIPSLPDLSIENASAFMQGRYVNANVSIKNNGFQDAQPSLMVISADGNQIKQEPINSVRVGEGFSFQFQNIFVPSMSVKELEFSIESNFSEIQKNNNEIKLVIKN